MKHILDPHLHFFELALGQHQWLKEEKPPFWPDKSKLRQYFHEDALSLNQGTELAGFVHVEAGFDNVQPWREIAWLESSCTLPFKAVAGIDLTLGQADFVEQISRLLEHQTVVGCRHILDDQPVEILSQQNVQSNLAYLAKHNLSFDLQMPLTDKATVDLLVNILNKLPTLRLIINHAGWPPLENTKGQKANAATDINVISNPAWHIWQSNLVTLSQFEQCAIKCSGWEMAERDYKQPWQLNVIRHCLDAFGDKRVMLASNFPLVLLTQDYCQLWEQYLNLDLSLNLSEQQITALTYANAAYWYQFSL